MVCRPVTIICILLITAVFFSCCVAVPFQGTYKQAPEPNITNKLTHRVFLLKNALYPSTTSTEIETSPGRYIPLMSSTVGIRLSPKMLSPVVSKQSWETSFGHFVTWGVKTGIVEKYGRKFTTNGEEPVYWTYDPHTMGLDKPPVEIRLTLYNVKNGSIFSRGKVSIRWEDQDTAVVIPSQ